MALGRCLRGGGALLTIQLPDRFLATRRRTARLSGLRESENAHRLLNVAVPDSDSCLWGRTRRTRLTEGVGQRAHVSAAGQGSA